jgi:hypothetical protein
MEPAQAKPPRKRRRWLIVALLLVLVSGLAWWYWPRGDARFVGKWAAVNRLNQKTGGAVTFSANGYGSMTFPSTTSRLRFRWEVVGKGLIMISGPTPSGQHHWWKGLFKLHSTLTGDEWIVGRTQLNLKRPTDGQLWIGHASFIRRLESGRLTRL